MAETLDHGQIGSNLRDLIGDPIDGLIGMARVDDSGREIQKVGHVATIIAFVSRPVVFPGTHDRTARVDKCNTSAGARAGATRLTVPALEPAADAEAS
jgi:hypothetical protein